MALMTVLEHDELWRHGAKSLPKIESDLRYANVIACMKALYEAGEISKDVYTQTLAEMIKKSGFEFK